MTEVRIEQGESIVIDGGAGESIVIEESGEVIVIEGATIITTGPAPTPFTIDSFATSPALFEIGATVIVPTFSASYSDTPTQVVLTDDDGSPPKDVTSTPTSFQSDGTFQKGANNASVNFTLTADKATEQDVANRSITWQPRTFWGVAGAGPLTEAQIEALASNALDNNYQRSFAANAPTAADFIWYCFPQSYDPADGAVFQAGGLAGGFFKSAVVAVTNPNGVGQDYACWRSDHPQLGSITVTVSS